MDRLSIVNSTLAKVGQKRVAAVTETKASRAINDQLKDSLGPVLTASPWDELKKNINIEAATEVSEITQAVIGLDIYNKVDDYKFTFGTRVLARDTTWQVPDAINIVLDSSQTFDEHLVDSYPNDLDSLALDPTGLKLFTYSNYAAPISGRQIRQWDLATAWDVTSIVEPHVKSFSPVLATTQQGSSWFNDDGTRLFILEGPDAGPATIHSYSLSTPWDLDTVSALLSSYTTTNSSPFPSGIDVSKDGTKLVVGVSSGWVYIQLGTPWDLSTADELYAYEDTPSWFPVQSFFINDTGTQIVMCNGASIKTASLTIPWDLRTIVLIESVALASSSDSFYLNKSTGHIFAGRTSYRTLIVDKLTSDVAITIAGWSVIDTTDYSLLYYNEGVSDNPPPDTWLLPGGAASTITVQLIRTGQAGFTTVIPNDFCRLVEEDPKGYYYDRINKQFVSETDTFYFSYVALPTNILLPSHWYELDTNHAAFDNLDLSGELVDILGYHILSRCAYSITGDHDDTQIFTSLYDKALAKGQSTSAQQKRDLFMQVSEETSWEGARI